MSPRSPRKRKYAQRAYVRKAEGAKAPEAFTLSGEEFQALCKNVASYIEARSGAREAWQGADKAFATSEIRNSINKVVSTIAPPPNPPYKGRIENIFVGLVELRQSQRGFLGYLNPTPEPGTAASGSPPMPSGLDELISAIECELNLNQILFRDLQNKF